MPPAEFRLAGSPESMKRSAARSSSSCLDWASTRVVNMVRSRGSNVRARRNDARFCSALAIEARTFCLWVAGCGVGPIPAQGQCARQAAGDCVVTSQLGPDLVEHRLITSKGGQSHGERRSHGEDDSRDAQAMKIVARLRRRLSHLRETTGHGRESKSPLANPVTAPPMCAC